MEILLQLREPACPASFSSFTEPAEAGLCAWRSSNPNQGDTLVWQAPDAYTCCDQYLGVAFQKEIIIIQCDLDRKGHLTFEGKKYLWKTLLQMVACLRALDIRLEKHGFCGEMFTEVAANNAFLLCTHVLLPLSSGEVYDSRSLNWVWLSDLI